MACSVHMTSWRQDPLPKRLLFSFHNTETPAGFRLSKLFQVCHQSLRAVQYAMAAGAPKLAAFGAVRLVFKNKHARTYASPNGTVNFVIT